MKLIGAINICDNVTNIYYANGIYCDEKGTQLDRETMKEYAIYLVSPWDDDSCIIESTKRMRDKIRATKTIICYDFVSVEAYGYGKTEKEAKKKCDELIKEIQKEYNKRNICF